MQSSSRRRAVTPPRRTRGSAPLSSALAPIGHGPAACWRLGCWCMILATADIGTKSRDFPATHLHTGPVVRVVPCWNRLDTSKSPPGNRYIGSLASYLRVEHAAFFARVLSLDRSDSDWAAINEAAAIRVRWDHLPL